MTSDGSAAATNRLCGETSRRHLSVAPGAGDDEVMITTPNTTANITWVPRLLVAVVLAVALTLAALGSVAALGAVAAAHADSSATSPGPNLFTPTHHPAFPHQSNAPQPGSRIHHHHQHRHG